MPKKIEYQAGQSFYDLTIIKEAPKRNNRIYWLCQCICGKEIEVRADMIGKKQNCGCKKGLDLTGQTFGYLTAIKKLNKKNGTNNIWLFKCICGKEVELDTSQIKTKKQLSCGCQLPINIKDLKGQRFGKLKVISYTEKRANEGSIIWRCECDCGNIIEVPTYNLVTNHTTSCGCKQKETLANKTYKGESKISNILKENNITYETQKFFSDLKDKNILFFDFFLPKYNCLIEFDGEQHYRYIPFFYKTQEQFKTAQSHDQLKNEYCLKNNIPLIRIPYAYLNDIVLEDLLPQTSKFLIKER